MARAEQQHVAGDNLDEPKLSIVMALGLMLTSTVLAGFTCEWLIGSINGIAEDQNVSKEWLALILLPLLGVRFFLYIPYEMCKPPN